MKTTRLVAITLGCLAVLSACTSVPLAQDSLPASTPTCKDCPSEAVIPPVVNPTPTVQPIPSPALPQPTPIVTQPERVTPPPVEPSPRAAVAQTKTQPAAAKTTSKIDRAAKKSAVRPPASVAHGLFVNVGLFAVAENANRAFKKLQDAGLDATKQEMSGKKGTMTRVSVGPFPSRAMAETTVKQIHGLKLDAIVVQR